MYSCRMNTKQNKKEQEEVELNKKMMRNVYKQTRTKYTPSLALFYIILRIIHIK